MFDGLLKSKFYTKCKSAIKLTKTRLDLIKRKRSAMQMYLRNDIADLLKNGQDIIAYGRAEGLLVERNLTSCYELVEQFIICISNHLSIMNKQRECPEECREAVPSLMFAAARFADLPELRDLRTLFNERYGNSLESHINKEFVGRLKAGPPTKDMKLQLLQNVATESGLDWDSKALEQKLYKPPAAHQEFSKIESSENKHNSHKSKEDSFQKTKNQFTENTTGSKVDDELPFSGRNHRKEPEKNNHSTTTSAKGVPEEEETDRNKPVSYKLVPPPYIKTKPVEEPSPSVSDPPFEAKSQPKSVRRRHLKPPPPGQEESSPVTPPLPPPPLRVVSLPVLQGSQVEPPVRATSFQPEMMNPAGHVHPKLPDYDDFVARLAALRGK